MKTTTNGPGRLDTLAAPEIDPVERGVLVACLEVTRRQTEMLPLLAAAVGVPAEEVYRTWALRQCRQSGDLAGTPWSYFFHGIECDLQNRKDGRFLRIDFGPGGRLDTFTAWGVLQFIMTAVDPWLEQPELKAVFARGGPPVGRFSGEMGKLIPVWDRLTLRGLLQMADPALVQFEESCTTIGPDGLRHVRFPPGTSDIISTDCSVARRNVLSPLGHEVLRQQMSPRLPRSSSRN